MLLLQLIKNNNTQLVKPCTLTLLTPNLTRFITVTNGMFNDNKL